MVTLILLTTLLAACSDRHNDNNGSGSSLLDYELPGDISAYIQSDIDYYSWKTFLALNAPEVGSQVALHGDNLARYRNMSMKNLSLHAS